MDRRKQFRRTRIIDTRERRSAGVPPILIWSPCVISIRVDSDICIKARYAFALFVIVRGMHG